MRPNKFFILIGLAFSLLLIGSSFSATKSSSRLSNTASPTPTISQPSPQSTTQPNPDNPASDNPPPSSPVIPQSTPPANPIPSTPTSPAAPNPPTLPPAVPLSPSIPSQTPTTAPTDTLPPVPAPTDSPAPVYLVSRIIDGDTIQLASGERVRLIGIDTPESGQPYYKEAADTLVSLILNQQVTLTKDVSETDKYGRLLRYVYLNELFINEEIIRRGYAKVFTYPPDVKFAEQFRAAENTARTRQLGLWSPVPPTASTCLIKGNISSNGEKIYHLPAGAFYDKTYIDESKGERWFCTEADAQAAGWRRSKQ